MSQQMAIHDRCPHGVSLGRCIACAVGVLSEPFEVSAPARAFEWAEPPQKIGHAPPTTVITPDVLRALRALPGRWARIYTKRENHSLRSQVYVWRKKFPELEIVTRGDDVYARARESAVG